MPTIGSYQVWPEGLTWVFQGTVAETADAGTHVVSLTVTPGVGNEMQVLYGMIKVGNTATSQIPLIQIDDGTNALTRFASTSITTANTEIDFPSSGAATSATGQVANPLFPTIVSGLMRLILQVTTAAVSVTQTFAVVCRIKGSAPTATLNDTVGIFTPTTNTNKVFG